MQFWWATQTKNYELAVPEGSLWTVRWADGRLPIDRARIKELRAGDLVFHYGKRIRGTNHIGAVSRVSAEASPMLRPDAYSTDDPTQANDGLYVAVDVFENEIAIPFQRAFELIGYEHGGPFDLDDRPGQRYLSALTDEQAAALLSEVDIVVPLERDTDVPRRAGETTKQALVNQRVEQSILRTKLLNGSSEGRCALCDRWLPAHLLVAAHIKRRSDLTDDERWDFDRIAMLACTLGCDALFEHGYLVIDTNGTISAGVKTSSADVGASITAIAGRACSAWNSQTAENFASHANNHRPI